MSKKRGQEGDKLEEAELISHAISRLASASYEVTQPSEKYPPNSQQVKWFVFAPNLDQVNRTAHADALWEDSEGRIWIESNLLGDSSDWIETEYGEDGCIDAQEMDLTNFKDSDVRKRFEERFPLVDRRLRAYEDALVRVSNRRKVELQMRYDGAKGIVTFYMDAKIDASGLNLQSKLERIKRNVKALEEALIQIEKYEAERAKVHQ